MKLIKIVSDLDNQIDEALVIVPDDYDANKVLLDIADVIPEPTITEEAVLYNDSDMPIQNGFDEYREYIG